MTYSIVKDGPGRWLITNSTPRPDEPRPIYRTRKAARAALKAGKPFFSDRWTVRLNLNLVSRENE
jgi:hypothetical protein